MSLIFNFHKFTVNVLYFQFSQVYSQCPLFSNLTSLQSMSFIFNFHKFTVNVPYFQFSQVYSQCLLFSIFTSLQSCYLEKLENCWNCLIVLILCKVNCDSFMFRVDQLILLYTSWRNSSIVPLYINTVLNYFKNPWVRSQQLFCFH